MTRFKLRTVAPLLLTLLLPAIASAQYSPWHFSGEIARVDGLREFKETTQLQGAVGYDFLHRSWGVLTGELAVGTTIGGGDSDRAAFRGDWDVTTIGAFVTYRTDEVVFYPLARLGIQYADATVNFPRAPDRSDSDAALAAGIGAGWRIAQRFAIELSWTRAFVDVFGDELDIIAVGVRF